MRGQTPGKYNAKGERVVHRGKAHWIPSDAQAERCRQLIELEEAGTIDNLQFEVTVPLQVNGKTICRYRVDAVYDVCVPGRPGIVLHRTFEEVKGFVTADWRIKRALFDATQDRPLAVIMIDGTEPILDQDGERVRDGKGRMLPKSRAQWMKVHWEGRLPDGPAS